jgi:hypothetical protein
MPVDSACLLVPNLNGERKREATYYPKKVDIGIYRHGIKCKTGGDTVKNDAVFSKRGNVTIFSKRSKSRLAWVYSQGEWKSMLTLTYHVDFPKYKDSKKQLNAFLQHLRRDGIKYLWVVEFQERGYPHYHVWMDKSLERNEWHKYMDTWLNVTKEYNSSEKAVKVHKHDASYTEWDVRYDLNYAVKYANKQQQKGLPVGIETFGRWWGTSKDIIHPEIVLTANFTHETEENECLSKELTKFRRNVKRTIFHWCKRKKRNAFDKKTNVGFTYILNDNRKKCVERLYYDAIKTYESITGQIIAPGTVWTCPPAPGAIKV